MRSHALALRKSFFFVYAIAYTSVSLKIAFVYAIAYTGLKQEFLFVYVIVLEYGPVYQIYPIFKNMQNAVKPY